MAFPSWLTLTFSVLVSLRLFLWAVVCRQSMPWQLLHICTLSSISISSVALNHSCIISCGIIKGNILSFHCECVCVWWTARGPGFSSLPVLVITWLRDEECVSVFDVMWISSHTTAPCDIIRVEETVVCFGWRLQWNLCQWHTLCRPVVFNHFFSNADTLYKISVNELFLHLAIHTCFWFIYGVELHCGMWISALMSFDVETTL